MVKQDNSVQLGGIQFFGKMSASATHEIKNTQSIINENAGLLMDLISMADQGQTLSLERVKKISGNIINQVKRTDLILSNLNQFSHSPDLKNQILNLEEIVRFVLDLSSRLIDMKSRNFHIQPASAPIMLDANQFYLENLIWNALEHACKISVNSKDIEISFGTRRREPSIWFTFTEIKKESMNHIFDSSKDIKLIQHMGIIVKKENNNFGLIWPNKN